MQNLDLKPYNAWVREKRAKRMINLYPQYDKYIIDSWSQGESFSEKEIENS